MRTTLCVCLAVLVSGCGRNTVAVDPPPAGRADAPERRPDRAARGGKAEKKDRKSSSPGHVAPDDRGAKLMADLLRPADPDRADGPRRRGPGPRLNEPELPAGAPTADVVRLPPPKAGRPYQPRSLPAELPPARDGADPLPPGRKELPAGPRVRVPSPDVNLPVPLPVLGKPARDRGPAGDPTEKASTAAALAKVPPARTTPAPFVRFNLPDPFEHRQAVRLRAPPADDDVPLGPPPRKPGP